MTREIDVMHRGRDRVICAHLVDGVIIDPGPASSLETLLDALGDEAPRALLLTHIHLDHAGGSGVLAREFPELEIYVHERGAPHMIDPSRLIKSARPLYDGFDELWGEIAPVPEDRIRVLEGGERVLGFRAEYTPGHASHHVCYLHEDTGAAFVGDMAGVRIPPHEYTVPPLPPPDIDLEVWKESLDTIEEWEPSELRLTHFGKVDDVAEQLDRVRDSLDRWGVLARDEGAEKVEQEIEREVREALDPGTADRMIVAVPPVHCRLGLERYWRKRREREEAEA